MNINHAFAAIAAVSSLFVFIGCSDSIESKEKASLERGAQTSLVSNVGNRQKQSQQPTLNGNKVGFVSLELERAVLEQDADRVEKLLSNKVSPLGRTPDGRDILHVASEYQDTRIPLLLIRCGAVQDSVSASDETPIDVLIRNGFVAEELRDESYAQVQFARTIMAIESACEAAEANYARGVELMQLRAELLAESKRDQEYAIRTASILSFEQTGSRATGPSPEALMIPYENRQTSPMWRDLRRKNELHSGNASLPGWENTYRTKPLPDDLYKPLELPIPPQFDEGIKILEWCVVRAALAYGTESDEFKSFLIQAKQFVAKTTKAKAMH